MNNKEFEKYLIDSKLAVSDGAGGFLFRVSSIVTGSSVRTPALIQSIADGSTPVSVVSFSIAFRGDGGSLNNVPVPNGYIADFGNGTDIITTPMTYKVPTTGEKRVLITTLS